MRTGVSFSPDSLRKSDVPRVYVGRNALYAEEDLHAYADERLNRAVLHQGPRSLKRRRARRIVLDADHTPERAAVLTEPVDAIEEARRVKLTALSPTRR